MSSGWDNFTNWMSNPPGWLTGLTNDPVEMAKNKKANQDFVDWFEGFFKPPKPTAQAGTATATKDPSSSATDLASIYQSLFGPGSAASSGAATAPAGYYTPDGVWINDGSPQDTYYRMVDSVWTRIYGQHPAFSMAQTFRDQGVENTAQLDTIMKQMPSHITNPDGTKMPIGQYDVIKGTGETFSDKYFGRPIPDSLIQDWAKKGITDPQSIELWFLNHPAKDVPKEVYGQIFDAASAQVKQTWNDLPHPDTVNSIYQNLKATP